MRNATNVTNVSVAASKPGTSQTWSSVYHITVFNQNEDRQRGHPLNLH